MQAPTVPGHGAQQPQLQQADPNPFSCNVCQRSYTRIDHLARHFRSHTSEKPFTCGECGKDFARPDLLKRHVGSHGDAGSHSNKRQKVSQAARSRIQQACLTCAEAKLKCEGPAPCRRCQQKDLPCTYPESRQKKSTWLLNRPEPAVNVPLINESELTQQELPFNRAGASQVQYLHHTTSLQPLANASNAAFVRTEENAQAPAILGLETSMTFAPSGENLAGSAVSTIYEDRMFAEFLKDIMMPNTLNGDGRPTRPDHVFDYSTKDVLDFTVDTVFEMPDLLDISHQMPSDFSFQPARHNENAAGPCKSGCSTPAGRGGISLGAQAFRESLWLWTPAKEDFTQAEQPNLSIPSQEQMPEAQNSPLEAHVRSIDRIARDKILAMVLETCDASIVPRVVQSFPSCELLTNLMYNFLTYHSMITDSWIHVATFDSSLESPQMLSAVIAAGATQSHLPDIRKLGFAFVEASRDALVRMFERDNRHTRCLRPMQAMALQLDVGLWSGDRRKMEIAESLAQPLITMMRRGGRFRQPRQLPTPPQFDDDERTTEFKWLQWVEAESFRRFAFHMLIRDCHTSISLLNPPLLPHSEVSIEMPASRELWLARNATEWKALYLELFDGRGARLPSLRTCVDGFSLITQQRKLLDIDLVVMIILSGLWALVWQYREIITSVKHFNNSSVRNGPLITRLLYQETSQNLLHFKMAAHEWTGGMEPIAQALYERQMTHLYVSLEDVQLVAGKEGEDEARRVFPLLGAWVDSHESRLALWHAGQVIKTARGFRRSGLRSASAIALYHASLVMWAYSVASKSTEPPEDKDHLMTHLNGTEGSHLAVRLDGEDSPQVQRFLVLGVGIPAIGQGKGAPSVADGLVPINDAKRVMLATTSILREKNEVENLGCPPLVENLIKLMRSLGNAAQGMRRERSS